MHRTWTRIGAAILCAAALAGPAPARAEAPTVAVSLAALQAHVSGRPSPERDLALRLGGLTRVDGFVVDDDGRDLLLFGVADERRPELRTEDFVIALRSAFRRYARTEGNTRIFEPPGCSIDPTPQALVELQRAAGKMGGAKSVDETERAISAWEKSCQRPQAVRVVGIPYDSRFARTIVEADYEMKRLVNGVDSVKVPGFASLTRRALDRARASGSAELSPMDRFWFESGDCTFASADGIVRLTRCDVALRTEEERVSKRGEARGTGRSNALADRFAREFTEHYAAIARERSEYVELESLFRFVGLAELLRARGDEAGLRVLLESFALPVTKHPRQRTGLANVERVVNRKAIQGGVREQRLWMPSCGGVSMAVTPRPAPASGSQTRDLKQLRAALLASRPAADSLRWKVTGR